MDFLGGVDWLVNRRRLLKMMRYINTGSGAKFFDSFHSFYCIRCTLNPYMPQSAVIGDFFASCAIHDFRKKFS